jgi:nucleoside-diphosphate-sugar epimerase
MKDELVVVGLVDLVEDIAGIKLTRRDGLGVPNGVMGRNSDNTLIRKYLNWEPGIPLRAVVEKTYAWIHDNCVARQGLRSAGVR